MAVSSLQGAGLSSPTSLLSRLLSSTDRSQQNQSNQSTNLITQTKATDAKPTKANDSQSATPLNLNELSSQANIVQAFSLQVSQGQFNIQGDGFSAQGATQSLSLQATLQQGDNQLSFSLQIQQSVVGVSFGSGSTQTGTDSTGSGNDFLSNLLDRLPADAKELVKRFQGGEFSQDYFSPKNVANRISDFALAGFNSFDGGKAAQSNTQDDRQKYLDYIVPAIEKGFQQAQQILGKVPDQVQAGIDQTRSFIVDRLKSFLNGDSSEEDDSKTKAQNLLTQSNSANSGIATTSSKTTLSRIAQGITAS